MSENWIVLEKIQGELQAEIIKGLLEAQEIPVMLTPASVSRALSIPGLSIVQVLVPESYEQRARELLETDLGDEELLPPET